MSQWISKMTIDPRISTLQVLMNIWKLETVLPSFKEPCGKDDEKK